MGWGATQPSFPGRRVVTLLVFLSMHLIPGVQGGINLEALQDLPPAKDWTYNRSAIHQQVDVYNRRFARPAAGDLTSGALRAPERLLKRRNLLVVVGGDNYDCTKWMDAGTPRNWDLIWIYYGVYRARGPKWRLAWRLTLLSEWQNLTHVYDAIGFWDDDLIVRDGTVINTVFDRFHEFGLLMGQPSICRTHWSWTPYDALFQRSDNVLRYTNHVEIMAPVFDMSFFDAMIRPTLYNTHYGWGLDFVWPFLMHYPPNKIGVIDEVCVFHPPTSRAKGNTLYHVVAPYSAKQEEQVRFREWGFTTAKRMKLGWSDWNCDVIQAVPRTSTFQAGHAGGALLQSAWTQGGTWWLLLAFNAGVCFVIVKAVVAYRSRRGRNGSLLSREPRYAHARF